ncbi:probable purple acid phosphatase 20 [Dioscorea cayenensis subsp. rotundata]|uniref:Purple acid phosphatase n=1 Tax=Dioscorea cayennensis subsp. rotundata TaxID=55577 RepID=A0AB40C035_DIOCR|nr:probable purple acid phosphatase 20 [Dioscorea cayenensis subsp. rotundata]
MATHGLLLVLIFSSVGWSVSYQRPPAREILSVPLSDDADGLTPQQVHISLVGSDKMRVTWITEDDAPSTVDYGTSSGSYSHTASGSTSSYSYLLYDSGRIHDVIIGPLNPNSIYYYRCGSNPTREFSFKTPPAQLPIKLAVIGDLGQTGWTNSTLQHLTESNYDTLLLPGDLSYADFYQPLWDSFGRLVEPLASTRPWMVTQGNHEIEKIPILEPSSFKAYNARWRMPYDMSSSDSNLYYSFDVAGGAVHVLMLGSYTDFDSGSAQYKWLVGDLAKVNRKKTPWLLALVHAPWYNSNDDHQGEGEDMRKSMEDLLYKAKVDVVFAGHVHAYERFDRVYNNKKDGCGPVYITIGDGGNREGLATEYLDPQPVISLFREASFGHGQFSVVNATHAQWSWHRNDDDEQVIADQIWLTSLVSQSAACG